MAGYARKCIGHPWKSSVHGSKWQVMVVIVPDMVVNVHDILVILADIHVNGKICS